VVREQGSAVKLRHIHIENFKGIKSLDIPLAAGPDDPPRRLTCLVGDNGSGKTTVLQAIALTLSLATRRTRDPSDFRWHGFLPERVGSLGRTAVELTIEFDQDEVLLAQNIYETYLSLKSYKWKMEHVQIPPSLEKQVRIRYSDGTIHLDQQWEINKLSSRYYLRLIEKNINQFSRYVNKIGDIFWFDQYRNLGTVINKRIRSGRIRGRNTEGWGAGVEQLRESLVGWWAYYASDLDEPDKNAIKDLEEQFAKLFPGTTFRGTMPRAGVTSPGVKDFYFLLERDGRQYDLAEMASGEQAIFSLLYDFIRLKIVKSIVLVDELELHLHPPAQQALYAALPKLGPDCQFIVTTHSEFLTGVIPLEQIVRLEGGRPCL
jgi:energy-coupling factor transporter ATP-binding protein EcfA2